MQISYTEPLSRGYAHMKRMLFEPFNLEKWFVVGFTCWLAQLLDGDVGGGIGNLSNLGDLADDAEASTLSGWEMPEVFSSEESWLVGCILVGVIVVIALIVLALWLSSRGRFMFLHNVIHDRAEVRKPWREFRELGNSLFRWRLGFSFVALVLIALTVAPIIYGIFYVANDGSSDLAVPLIVLGVVPLIVAGIGIAYVELFLKHFVVPIMHREGLTTNAAWSRFLPLLKANVSSFLVYGLFMVVVWIAITIAVWMLCLFTCCIAGFVLAIPYLGTVAILPVLITIRAFSLEFLQQWMPEIGVDRSPEAAIFD